VLENMVARDGVERFGDPCFQQVTDSTKDRNDTEDRKDGFCVRFVCDFSLLHPAKLADVRHPYSFENRRGPHYICEVTRKKHWSDRVLREPLTITYKGKEYSGYCQAGLGMVRVTYDSDSKATQFRTHPEVTARILLRELVEESLKRSE